MVKPAHIRLSFEGLLGTGNVTTAGGLEAFSCSLSGPVGGIDTIAELTALAVAGRAAWANTVVALLGPEVQLTEVTAASIVSGGTYAVDAEGTYQQGKSTGNTPGQKTTGAIMPRQNALCISLMTPRLGPTGRGRFFLPITRQNLVEDGRLSASDRDAYRDACAAMLGSLVNNAGWRPQVVSSKGYATSVTGVRVGRVVDTLRSRRRSQVEDYSSTSF